MKILAITIFLALFFLSCGKEEKQLSSEDIKIQDLEQKEKEKLTFLSDNDSLVKKDTSVYVVSSDTNYNESLSDEDFERLSNDSIPASFPDTDPFPLKK